MANGFIEPDDEQEDLQKPPEEDLIHPSVIHLLVPDYAGLPHEEAVENLKQDYTRINWEDKDQAAKNYAEAVDSLHQLHDVTPDSGINESFSETLDYVLRENHSDEDKLARIDEDYAKAVDNIYENTDADSLSSALQLERELDAVRLYLRRGIISKNTGRLKDMIARGADAAISPLAGTADAVFDTDYRKSLREYTMETTRPEYDESVFSMGASYIGTIGGFAASTFIPYGPALYLGASLTNQSKEVYDQTLEETNDHTLAEQAMTESIPWNVMGVLGDRIVGGWAGKLLKGKGTALGAVKGTVKGAIAEGGTEALQEYGVGKTLTKYTGNPLFTPSENELLKIFAVSGVIGGAIGGVGGIRAKQIEANKQLAEAIAKNEPVKIGDKTIEDPQGFINTIREKWGRYLILKKKAENTGKTVEEVAAEEGVSKGANVIQEIQQELRTALMDRMSPEDIANLPPLARKQRAQHLGLSEKGVAEGKSYDTEKYSHSQPVKITFDDGTVIYDAIKGLNKGHAIARAEMNWEGAKIEAIDTLPDEVYGEPAVSTPEDRATLSEADTKDPTNFSFAWPSKENATSFVFGVHIAEELGTKMSVGFIDQGVLGAAGAGIDPNTGMLTGEPTLRIVREFFKNPGSMLKVFFHELSHRISQTAAIEDGLITEPVNDAILDRYRQTPALQKYVRVYRDLKAAGFEIDPDAFRKEIDALDMSYQPYIKKPRSSYTKYRESGEEQLANSFSAILNEPEMVRDNYPLVWKAFKKAVEAHPKLKELVNLTERAKTDPTVLGEVYGLIKKKGQDFETQIVKEAATKRLKEKKAEGRVLTKESIKSFKRGIFSRFTYANSVGEQLKKAGVDAEQVHEMLTMLKAVETTYANIHANVDDPLIKTKDKLLANAVTAQSSPETVIRNLANLMDANHIRSDTNATIDDIKDNPDNYKRAVDVIGQFIGKPEWHNEISNLEGEDLVVGLSKLFVELNAKSKYNTRMEMMKRNEDYAARLLEDNTFEIRRLQANYGVDYESADPVWNSMKVKLERAGTWEHYETALKEIHKIGYDTIAALDHAGLLDAKLRDKLMRNVETYATQNVLKYFQKDPRIPASIRKTIGSWEMTGNSLTSYSGKTKALMMRAAYQETQNNVFKLAEMFNPNVIKEIEVKKHYGNKRGIPTVFYDSVFDTRTVMEKKNPDKSYFITAEEGNLRLMEIDNPEYAKMFKQGVLEQIPVVQKVTGWATALNKMMLAHWGKTLGSASFVFRSPFRDIQREALVAGSKEVNLHHLMLWARHFDPELHSIRKDLAKGSWAQLLRGETSPHLRRMHDYHALTESQAREYGGITEKDTFEQGVYNLLPGGKDIPASEDMLLSDKWNKAGINFIRKLPFMKWIELKAQADELTTKQMGFWLAEHKLEKGPWEAGRIARDWFGTPDPTGGGSEMGSLNQLFMFSRAHANGMRVIGEIFKENPQSFMFQYAYRKMVPRMLMTSAFIGPVIGAMLGDEEEEKYRKYLDKIASYNKLGKHIIPLGFVDEQGAMRYFDVDPREITDKWKAAAIAIPMERDLISVDQLNEPIFSFIEDLLETGTISGKRIANDVASSMGQVFGGHMSTGLQTVWHLGLGEVAGHETMLTGNPKDYFRKRGILPKDVAEAGSFYQRFTEYAMWSMYSNYPAMFGRPTKKYSTEPTSFFQTVTRVPQLGAALKAFTLVTNYGDIEKSKEAAEYRKSLDSDIRLNMGTNSKAIYNEASGYSGMMQAYGRQGKKWREEVSPEVRRKMDRFNKWKARYYIPALQEMREARLAGDVEKENQIRERLERASTKLLEKYTQD